MLKPRARRLSLDGAFFSASASLVLVFVVAGAPIPMMGRFEAAGLSTADFAFASCFYFVAAAAGLLVLGRLSGFLGRRPVAVLALVVAALGCLALIDVRAGWQLMVGRGLHGLACGIAPGALGAFVVDAAGSRRWQPALITSSAPMMGLPIGAVAAGLALGPGGLDVAAVLLLLCAAAGLCAGLLWWSPETVERRRGARASMRPRLGFGRSALRSTLASAAIFAASWPLGGFYQAFGSVFAADVLSITSVTVASLVFACIFVLNPVGGLLASRTPALPGVRWGMTVYAISLGGVHLALRAGEVVWFVCGCLVTGLVQGIAATSAMRLLLPQLGPAERSGALALVYLTGYSSVAVAGLGAGLSASVADLPAIALIYGVIGLLFAVLAIVLPVDPHITRSQHGHE